MSKIKKESTQASFVKVLTIAELRDRLKPRQHDPSKIAEATETALERLKNLAAESNQSVQEYVASQQLLLREKAISLAETEF